MKRITVLLLGFLFACMVLVRGSDGKNTASNLDQFLLMNDVSAEEEPSKEAPKVVELETIKVHPTQDPKTKEWAYTKFSVPGISAQNVGPIEFFIAAPGSEKQHEIIAEVNCTPKNFHLATVMIDRKSGKPVSNENGKYQLPTGDRVVIYLEWEDENKKVIRRRAEDLLLLATTQKPMRQNGWVFTGSYTYKDPNANKQIYRADVTRVITASYHTPSSVLDNPSWTGSDDGLFVANTELLPAPGTKITIWVELPSKEDEANWAKWDDERDVLGPGNPFAKKDVIEVLSSWSGMHHTYDGEALFPTLGDNGQPEEVNDKMWRDIWAKAHPAQDDQPALPAVDFKKERLLAFFSREIDYPEEQENIPSMQVLGVEEYTSTVVFRFGLHYPLVDIKEGAKIKTVKPWAIVKVPRKADEKMKSVWFKEEEVGEPKYQDFILSFKGLESQLKLPKIAHGVINDTKTWEESWKKLFPENMAPDVPIIDFDNQMIVWAARGATDALNDYVEIPMRGLDEKDHEKKTLKIHYTHFKPKSVVKDPTGKIFSPYHFIVTQKTDYKIEFEKSEEIVPDVQ